MITRIEERKCPRCAQHRTVNMGAWGSFCFNCRLQWDPNALAAPRAAVSLNSAASGGWRFAPDELRRLSIYRAAVKAGMYTDGLPPAGSTSADSVLEEMRS